MEYISIIQEHGIWVLFIAYLFVGWLINFTHQKKQYALEKRRDSEALGPLPVEQYNYQEAKYLREKHFNFISLWLGTISLILILIFFKLPN